MFLDHRFHLDASQCSYWRRNQFDCKYILSIHYLYSTLASLIPAVGLISKVLSEFQLFGDSLLKIIRFNLASVSSACNLTGESFKSCF